MTEFTFWWGMGEVYTTKHGHPEHRKAMETEQKQFSPAPSWYADDCMDCPTCHGRGGWVETCDTCNGIGEVHTVD